MSIIKRCRCGSTAIDILVQTHCGREFHEVLCGTCKSHSIYESDYIPKELCEPDVNDFSELNGLLDQCIEAQKSRSSDVPMPGT